MQEKSYYLYITTNPNKTTLYIGVTNNLARRLQEHAENKNNKDSFDGKYYCYNLIYTEVYKTVSEAIQREKEIKKWRRSKKVELIEQQNPNWDFMNDKIL